MVRDPLSGVPNQTRAAWALHNNREESAKQLRQHLHVPHTVDTVLYDQRNKIFYLTESFLENVPPFAILGALYICTRPSLNTATNLFRLLL